MSESLIDLARLRAEENPLNGFRFLKDGRWPTQLLTYAELEKAAQNLAAVIQGAGVERGSRVILVFGPGLRFVEAFWACLHAGAIVVPAPPIEPSRLQRTVPRLRAIVRDCRPALLLTDSPSTAEVNLEGNIPELRGVPIVNLNSAPDPKATWIRPQISADKVAMIQYTSGSTSSPRGVCVTHANLMHNLKMLDEFHGPERPATMVHWLPLYHDMGLIRGMLSPLHMGADCVMMSPADFIHRPRRWLDAVTRYRATHIGAPNFGYELCVRKISNRELKLLDLSYLRVAFCSSEPIRDTTVHRFIRHFSACGFKARAFRPSYGLAEATVMVSCELGSKGPHIERCERRALREGKFTTRNLEEKETTNIVSCGTALGGQEILVVDEHGHPCENDEIGEIWVKGPSIAIGYWRNRAATGEIFRAYLANGRGPYLKTGDLGRLSAEGRLFVTGRRKDLIIIRGQNFYPHDIEMELENEIHEIRPGCSAAISIGEEVGESLGVAAELSDSNLRHEDLKRVVTAMRRVVGNRFDVSLTFVALLAARTLPKTSSGKIQRGYTCQSLLCGRLDTIHSWRLRRNRLMQQKPFRHHSNR